MKPSSPLPLPTHLQTGRRRLNSRQLLAGDQELIIAHGQEEYRLRLTRQGKLILTK